MKKNLILILMITIGACLTGCTPNNENNNTQETETTYETEIDSDFSVMPIEDIDPGMIIDDVPDVDPCMVIDDVPNVDPGMIIEMRDTNIHTETHSVTLPVCDKPVIYIYPEEKTDVNVSLALNGELITTYPKYNENLNGWNMTAYPDGMLENIDDDKYNEYPYLFWEGTVDANFDMSKGFVVKGSDTSRFLEMQLSDMGLNYRESTDFITYWMPKMEKNNWNLITFQTNTYTDAAKLNINPKPDNLIRIFMVYKALDNPIEIEEPDLELFPNREGYTVVEWGGTEII